MLYDPKWEKQNEAKPQTPDWRSAWLKELRSGTHRKIVGEFERRGAYCALGVLCLATGQATHTSSGGNNWDAVRQFLSDQQIKRVYEWNDSREFSFPEIATRIERGELEA